MDTTASNVPRVSQLDGVVSSIGEKRPAQNGEDEDLTVPTLKKPRCGEDMKRVAEIVLVLSAMGRMRGGKSPTEAELELMGEARAKLAEMCEQFAPKDLVGRDSIGAVIEDLGLNGKLKDQRLGFRAPRLTISEKLSLAQRKMEESKKYPAPSAAFTSHMAQRGVAAGGERQGLSPLGSATHTVRTIPSEITSHAPVSSGGFPASSPYVTAASNVHLQNQWPSNEVKAPMAAAAIANNHYARDSSGLVQPRIKSDGGSSVLADAPQGQVFTSANHSTVNAPTWSVQTQSAFSAKSTAENKVPNPNSVRAGDQSFRPFIAQTAPGNFPGMNQPMQGMNFVQASPSGNNHAEIAKTIQKFLQPRVRPSPIWNPPSREYMNKAMTCQICQVTISDVESVLICDACEKGYHLKCLQANNLKGIPKFEWHCMRCVQLCNGKPFPPKYGRVMRSMNTPKVPSNKSGVQLPAEKKVGTVDPKVNQQKTSVNASPVLQGPAGFVTGGSNSSELTSHSETPNATSNASPSATSNAAPNLTENAALTITANAAQIPASNAAPIPASNAASDETANAAPNATSIAAPNAISSAALSANSNAGPNAISRAPPNAMLSATSNVTGHVTVNENVNATSNAGFGLQGPTVVSTGVSNSSEPNFLAETPNAKDTAEKDFSSSKTDAEQRTSTICSHMYTKLSETHSVPSVAPLSKSSDQNIKADAESSGLQEKSVPQTEDSVSLPHAPLSKAVSEFDNSQNPNNEEIVLAEQPNHAKAPLNDEPGIQNSEKTCERRNGYCTSEVQDDQQAVEQENDVGNSEPSVEVQGHP